jgi:hypothetical protein
MRGGSPGHGRYLIYSEKNDDLVLDDDTNDLRTKIAEVLIDFGGVPETIISGTYGVVDEDGDDDGESPLFSSTADFVAAGADFGDRLTVTFNDGGDDFERITFVEEISTNQLTVSPELPQSSVVSWILERNSVSLALKEAERYKEQVQAVIEVVEEFLLERNITIEDVVLVLKDQGMDRALDLLLEGRISEFAELTHTGSSFTGTARDAVQGSASYVTATDSVNANVAGTNPATGLPGSDAGSNASTSFGDPLPEEVDTIVSLSEGVSQMLADEQVQAAVSVSMDELRNRAIYELTGEDTRALVTDTDPLLPWVDQTGSAKQRAEERAEKMKASLQYMVDHPEEFDEPEEV